MLLLFLFNCLSIWWIKLLISILLEVIFRKISLLLLHPRHINHSNKKKTYQTKITQNRNLHIGAAQWNICLSPFWHSEISPFTSSHLSLSYSLSFQILGETKLFCSSNYLLEKGTGIKHCLRWAPFLVSFSQTFINWIPSKPTKKQKYSCHFFCNNSTILRKIEFWGKEWSKPSYKHEWEGQWL